MVDFKEIKTGDVWHISNPEHIKHFRSNPRYEEIVKGKEVPKKKNNKKAETKVEVEEVVEETTEE